MNYVTHIFALDAPSLIDSVSSAACLALNNLCFQDRLSIAACTGHCIATGSANDVADEL